MSLQHLKPANTTVDLQVMLPTDEEAGQSEPFRPISQLLDTGFGASSSFSVFFLQFCVVHSCSQVVDALLECPESWS